MPSLWKKHKGNKFSRLVAVLQTPHKRGGSLVVETGFPTSLVDLFVKNKDKLKKHNKKHKSSKKGSIFTDDEQQEGQGAIKNNNNNYCGAHSSHSISPLVSNTSVSCSELELQKYTIIGNDDEIVSQIDNGAIFNNMVVPIVVKNKGNVGEDDEEEVVGSNSKNVIMLSIFVGVLVLGVVLYVRKWILAMITLGFLLLLMLEYLGDAGFGWFKACENAVLMAVLKGALVVVVAFYTKWFVVGITIGASLLVLVEYAGNSAFFEVFKFKFKPCGDLKGKFEGIWSHCGNGRKERRECEEKNGRKGGGKGVLRRTGVIGSKRGGGRCDGGFDIVLKSDLDQGVGVGVGGIARTTSEPEFGNEIEVTSEEDEDGVASKGESEVGSVESTPSNENARLDTQNRPIYELIALESKDPRSLDGTIGGGGDKECVDDVANYRHGKHKKSKKFWKKLVPKKKDKKDKKDKCEKGRDNCASDIDSIQDTATDLEEEDEQEEGEHEISTGDGSYKSITDEDDEGGIDKFGAANRCFTEMLQLDNRTAKTCGIVKERCGSLKYLATTMMIPLTGLIGGRILAVGLTVICYLVFKMLRS